MSMWHLEQCRYREVRFVQVLCAIIVCFPDLLQSLQQAAARLCCPVVHWSCCVSLATGSQSFRIWHQHITLVSFAVFV
jgi:hypothetical protein